MSEAGAHSELDVEDAVEPEGESFVGTGLERVEDRRILTGEAEYIHDVAPENAVHLAFARSVHPHARIVDVDTSAAEEHPDCELVLTGEDVRADYQPMPCGLNEFEEWSLAVDKVRYVGEPVVAVVATDRYVAEDLVDLVDIEYEQLDPVVDALDAREDETVIHEDVGTNVPDAETMEFGEVEDTFESADNVVEREYSWGRISGVPLETAGVVAQYDPEHDSFDIDCNIQLHTLVDDTVYETLGYPPEKVSLEVPADVGGSFGTKIAIHRYCAVASMASQQLDGRPVKFVEDRVENLQGGDMHSSDREYRVRLAYDDDGTIEGLDTWFVDDFGAFPRYPVNQALKPLSVVNNAYDVDAVRYDYELVMTNKTSQTAYRGFGVPAHLHALEMVVDEAARELGVEPEEFRRRNLIEEDQMPYQLPTKNIYDSGDFPAALDRIREIVDERERCEGGLLDPEVVEAKREEGKYRGVSHTVHVEPGVSGSDWTDRQRTERDALEERDREDVEELPEHFRITLMEDGTLQAYIATDTSGQGHQTLVTQLLADGLEVLPSDIEVGYLDSVEAPTEYGTAASRMAVMLSGATEGAAEKLRYNCRQLAAEEAFGCAVEDVVYRDGGVELADGDGRVDLEELAELDADRHQRLTQVSYDYDHPATEIEDFDEALTSKYPVYPTAAFAANAPIVEVDVNTGEVEVLKFYSLRDCGTRLNPTIVDGQAHGGIAQGVGAALLEEFSYDDEGQPQAITMFDYLLPSTKNMPPVELEHSETPSPFTETGAKGTGEGGMIDGPVAVASSINDALSEFDFVTDQIPMTPHRVRQRLRDQE
ncbi:MAG: xanthine dehydrogenase family protein molybdopterin-binding subunit [Halobacterium sp.]